MKLFKKKIFYILLIIFIIVVLVVFNLRTKQNNVVVTKQTGTTVSKVSSTSVARNKVPVTVMPIAKTEVDIYKKTLGNVLNLNGVYVSSEVSGKLKNVKFNVGDRVKAGDLLATIDDKTLYNNVITQETSINTLKVQIADKEKILKRNQELYKNGYVSEADLESLEVELSGLKDNLVTAKTSLKNAKIELEKVKLIAPISGIIQSKEVAEGNFVSVGTQVFEIIDNSKLTIISSFPEHEYDSFKVGQIAMITSPSVKDEIKSTIKEIKPIIDEKSRSMQMVIEVDNKYNLRPGSVATVRVLVETKKDAIFVPSEAIVQRYSGVVAYVLDESKNKVIEKSLELGLRKDDKIEIIKGLQAGDTLVVEGAGFLVDKADVNIVSTQ